jgi:HSP20 family protein
MEGGNMMAWRYYPIDSIWHEMEAMQAELDNLFRQASVGGRLLPAGGVINRMLPAIRGEFRVDVRDHEDEIIVVADLPGVEKEAVALQLLNPRALEISCEHTSENEEKAERYSLRERMSGTMTRVVALPADMTDNDARASFRNGVLEVNLKKTKQATKTRIAIE